MFTDASQRSFQTLAWLMLAIAAILVSVEYGRDIDAKYPTRTFSVDGEATIDIRPDVAKFSVAVVSEGDKDVSAIQSENTEKMNRIMTFLKEGGIEEKDLKTEEYTLSPRYSYPNCTGLSVCPEPTITGYTLTQTLRVTVRDTGKMGDLLSGVVENGGNSVSQVSFTVDDEDAARNEARREAIAKAQEKAVAIAKDAGFDIGRLVSLYETPAFMPYGGDAEISAVRNQSGGMGGALPTIAPGTNETKVNVTLTYEIR